MKHFLNIIISLLIAASSLNASTWKSVGLNSLKVNCLLEVYETVIAGTENGLYFLDNDSLKQWIKYEGVPNLPIQDIIKASNDEIIVSAGNGSNSDGIYGGLGVFDGAPYYEFNLITFFDFPQALGYYNDTLLVGSKNSLNYAVRDSVQSLIPGIFFKPFHQITIPEYSFGIEDPVVSDISYSFTEKNFLIAGYDKSPMPGKGSFLSSSTITANEIFDSSTTSIYEHFEGWSLYTNLYVGGNDGLYKSSSNITINENSNSKTEYLNFEKVTTPNNNRINHVTGVMSSPIIIDGAADICIATNDGVYLKDYSNSWTEYGDIPEIANMVTPVFKTIYTGTTPIDVGYLYAATEKGVYRYNFYDSTPISFKNEKHKISFNNIFITNNTLKIKTNKNSIYSIEIFNVSGKTILKRENLNTQNITIDLIKLNLSSGTYLIDIKNDSNSSKHSINYIR